MLDIRSFQMAFRKLRQFSAKDEGPKTELDIDATIQKTCDNAGNLELVFSRPRKNTVRVLLLFDSDGSMRTYSRLCSQLFQAAHKSNHFKDLRVYYFHNCFYQDLFTNPSCNRKYRIDTMRVLNTIDTEYKVIVVGDAAMAPSELLSPGGASYPRHEYNKETGLQWDSAHQKTLSAYGLAESDSEARVAVCLRKRDHRAGPQGSSDVSSLSLDGLDAAFRKLLASR